MVLALYVQPFEADERLDELRAHPDVAAVGERAITYVRVEGTVPDLAGQPVGAAAVDDQYLAAVDRPRVLDGTMPDADDAAEIAVTEQGAAAYDVGVGDTVHIESLTPEQAAGLRPGPALRTE